jgi:hypothetical protein
MNVAKDISPTSNSEFSMATEFASTLGAGWFSLSKALIATRPSRTGAVKNEGMTESLIFEETIPASLITVCQTSMPSPYPGRTHDTQGVFLVKYHHAIPIDVFRQDRHQNPSVRLQEASSNYLMS